MNEYPDNKSVEGLLESKREKIYSFKELIVWQKSVDLVLLVYKLTATFPKSELYGITSQMRRSSVSIPSNIAEGFKRRHLGEYTQFLSISNASAAELETQVIISEKLNYSDQVLRNPVKMLLIEIQKMLGVMISKLRKG